MLNKPPRALIIDDDEDMCWVLCRIVEGQGYACTTATSGQEAMRLLLQQSFQVAFVDFRLPDTNGLELIPRLHQLNSRLSCVLVSGFLYPDDPPVLDALARGLILEFIGKPFLLEQMRRVFTMLSGVGECEDSA